MTNTLTSDARKSWHPDVSFVPARDAAPDSLLLNPLVCTTVPAPNGDVPVVRVPFVSSDPTATVVAEGDDIDVDNPELDELSFATSKLAFITRVSNEAMRNIDAGGTGDILTDSLRRAITSKADSLFLTNTPQEEPSEAQLSTAGLATNTNVTDGGTIDSTDMLGDLIDTLATLGDNGATPTAIIASNTAWARLLKLKYSDGRPVVNADVQAQALPMLLGLPVIRNAAAPADKIFVLDSANLFAAFSDVTVARDDSYFFGSDSVAIRVTARLGFGFTRSGMAAKLTVSAS